MLMQITNASSNKSVISPNGFLSPPMALQMGASSSSTTCNVFIGADTSFSHEVKQVSNCFQRSNIASQDGDIASATHYFLFVTDSFLKSKEHVLALISKLSDPLFKQRLFPVIMDKTLSIFRPGDELIYAKYWAEILKNTKQGSSEYQEIKAIEENIAPLIRAIRDTLMPPLNELLQKDLAPVTEAIEKRSHLLQTKRFFFLPPTRATIGQEAALVQLAAQFEEKPVVTVGGEKGMGKSSLAIEYAKRSERYNKGIFWLDATTLQTLEESFGKLAVQLGTSVEHAKRELFQMNDFLLIYDNVTDSAMIPSIPSAHTLIISNLSRCDILMGSFTDEDAERYIKEQVEASAEDARLLANDLENHPAKLSDALAYIKNSKISIQTYVGFYNNDRENLLAKQAASLQTKAAIPVKKRTLVNNLDPLPATIEKYSKQSVDELSRQIKDLGIQIFISYNWGSKTEVEQLDTAFKCMGIDLLRDAREMRNFDSIREFMKKVIRQADYTFSIITDSYIKSFNCLFEVITTLQDPHWRSRVFPIVLAGTNLDDTAILVYENHWHQEAARLNTGSTPAEAAIAQEGVQKIGAYLRFVREMQSEPFNIQLNTCFQKTLALMLARQEKLEKKGVYRQGIFHLSQGRNKDFTGREKELAALESSLKKGQYSAITNTGMGGVGKSQLALEYAYCHENEYELIYWINSETMGSLKSDLKMLGQEMGIAEDFLKEDKLISTMKGELEKRKGWLLVFDNAEDPQALLQVMPQRGGHVLVTSRNPNWAHTVSVEVFGEGEAVRYLQKISGVSGQEGELRLLAQELGYLPLALTQAGAYIGRQQIDVAAYRAAFKEGQKQMLSEHERGYPGSVGTAWLMSIDKITQEDPNAIKLLNFCSYLAPDNIPEEVLSAWLKEENKRDAGLDFQDALRVLESYSLISQKFEQKDGKQKKLISIHRLIQTVTRDQCEQAEATSAIQLGVDVLNEQFKGEAGTKEEREAAEAIVKHAIAVLTHAERQNLLSEHLGKLARKMGYFLWETDELQAGKDMLERALKINIAVLGENHTSVAESYGAIGNLFNDQNELNSAKEMYVKALKIYKSEKAMVENPIDLATISKFLGEATILNNLGKVLKAQGDLKGAKELHEKALEVFITFLDENHSSLDVIYNDLGAVLKAQGDLKGAKELHEKALKIELATLGENHSSVAISYDALGAVLEAQEDLKGAKELHEKALKIYINILGENHSSVATSYSNLGGVLVAEGDLKGAKEYYEKALKISLASLGENHFKVARCYCNLGLVLQAQEDLKGAKEVYEKALKIFIAAISEKYDNYSDVAVVYNNLGNVLKAQGDLKGAKGMHEKALKIFITILGENHSSVAVCYDNLGKVLKAEKNLKGAKEFYEKALKIRLAASDKNPDSVADSYNNLAAVLEEEGDLKQAQQYLEKVLKIKEENEENDMRIGSLYLKLGTLSQHLGEEKSAQKYLEKALSINLALVDSEDDISIAFIYMNLGIVLKSQGESTIAQKHLEKARRITIAYTKDENHLSVCAIDIQLAIVLLSQGDAKTAQEYLERVLKIFLATYKTENNIGVATCYNGLAEVFQVQGKPREAQEHYVKAIQISTACRGNVNNLCAAESYRKCGELYISVGMLDDAKKMLEEGLKIYISCLRTENHLDIGRNCLDLGDLCELQGKLMEASSYYNKAIKIRKACLETEDDISIAMIYIKLGYVLYAQGELKNAKEIYDKALKIYIAALGGDNNTIVAENIALMHLNIGSCCVKLGDLETAKKSLEEVHRILNDSSVSSLLGFYYIILGEFVWREGNHALAKEHHQKALQIMKNLNCLNSAKQYYETALKYYYGACYGSDNQKCEARGHDNLGDVYFELGQLDAAKASYEKALDIVSTNLEAENLPDAIALYNQMGKLTKKENKIKEAIGYCEKELILKIAVLGTKNNLEIGKQYDNLGHLRESVFDFEQAKEYYKSALDIKIKCFGEDNNHSSIAESYTNIGNILRYQEAFPDAKEYYEKALSILSACHDADNQNLERLKATLYYYLGEVCLSLKQPQLAKGYFLDAKTNFQLTGESQDNVIDELIKQIEQNTSEEAKVMQVCLTEKDRGYDSNDD